MSRNTWAKLVYVNLGALACAGLSLIEAAILKRYWKTKKCSFKIEKGDEKESAIIKLSALNWRDQVAHSIQMGFSKEEVQNIIGVLNNIIQ